MDPCATAEVLCPLSWLCLEGYTRRFEGRNWGIRQCLSRGLFIYHISIHALLLKKIPDRFKKSIPPDRACLLSATPLWSTNQPPDLNIPQTLQTTSSEGITFPQDDGARKDRREGKSGDGKCDCLSRQPGYEGREARVVFSGGQTQGKIGEGVRMEAFEAFKDVRSGAWRSVVPVAS